ncbi:MAG: hypothetical protein H6734_22605, partial [Alphaproteobacteria bacterium]|nr:hypothetical protein [Alphaproteobacteria bacterium]
MPLRTGTRRTPSLGSALARAALASVVLFALPASANTIALTPLIPNGADARRVQDVRQLMSSELEFMSNVSGIKELERLPPALNPMCLDDPGCLGGIMGSTGADALLTGTLTDQGGTIVLDLVYFSRGRVQRRQAYTVPADATALANQMTNILGEMLTGASQEEEAPTSMSALTDSDDDFFMASAPAPRPVPAPQPQQAAMGFGMNDGLVDAGPSAEELAYQARQQEMARQQAEAQRQAQMRAQQEA